MTDSEKVIESPPGQSAAPFTIEGAVDAGLFNNGFAEHLGLEFVELTRDRVRATFEVTPKMHQPAGILHGGVHCAVVETIGSVAGSIWFGDRGHVVGVNNSTDFIRAVREGTLTAEALPVHRGRSQQLWQIHITDEQDRLVARGQLRLQNLEKPAAR